MAKDDNGGLLSKVVRFVRNPATNWSDLDHSPSVHEPGQSQQMLRDLAERKKRNDFVRKREFDMLRKLRRRELAGTSSPAQRPSMFQSSLPSKPDERANTLKKIDEIEAQMSMQWWKTKHRESAISSVDSSMYPSSPTAMAPTEPAPMLGPLGSRYGKTQVQSLDAAAPMVAPPGSGVPPLTPASGAPVPAVERPAMRVAAGVPFAETSGSGFSASKSNAIEVGENAHDPELEEVCIRFANNDDKGAEAGLLDALGRGSERGDQVETWLTLFDLYRATGQQDRFEIAAIDFANQFQRSAPQWFSLPGMASKMAALQPPSSVSSQAPHWSCPPLLSPKSVNVLRDVTTRTAPPWRLDWTRLSAIEPGALAQLSDLLADWAGRPVEIRMTGADQLIQMLTSHAPSGDRSVATDWWLARLALLRVMIRPDEFELVALDYCVTYEVSPPSWEAPRCTFRSLNAGGDDNDAAATIIGLGLDDGETRPHETGAGFPATTLNSPLSTSVAVDLSGNLIGDISPTLEKLNAKMGEADQLTISCNRLVRVDFAAAGTLLNWVSSLQAQRRVVQFTGVHRLVAGFFSVLGISEMARVQVRTD